MLELSLGRLRISVSFWFAAVIGFFLLYERSVLFWYLAMPVLLHELGHVILLYLCGSGVAELRLRAFGIDMQPLPGQLSYPREIAVTLAGPAANLLTAAILYSRDFPTTRSMLLCSVNLAVALFNLLPIANLDGGALVRLLGERFGGVAVGHRLSKVCSFLVLIPLFALAFWLLLRPERNITLLIACLYLTASVAGGQM